MDLIKYFVMNIKNYERTILSYFSFFFILTMFYAITITFNVKYFITKNTFHKFLLLLLHYYSVNLSSIFIILSL